MKINIKIEGLGINPMSFVEYFKNNGIKQPAVYIDNGPIDIMNGIAFDPLKIIGRVESIDGFVAEITFIDTMLGRSVVKIINNNPDAFYITPRVICDKDGNVKNFISFDLHEYDDCVKCKEDKHMKTLTYWRNNSTGEIVGVFNMTDEWVEFMAVDLFGTHSLPKNDFLTKYKEVPKMPSITEGSTWVKKENMFHRVKVLEVGPGSMIKYRYISGFPDNSKEHTGLLVESNFKTTFMEYNDKYNENLVGSIWKFRDDEISHNVGSFIKIAGVTDDNKVKWVSMNHIKNNSIPTVFSKGTFPLSSLSKYCEKVADNDIGAKYRLVSNNNFTVEVKYAYPSFNNDNGDVSGFVQFVDNTLSLRYELSIDEFHMKYDLISLPEKHTENNESDKVSPKAPETKTEPKTTEQPASTYLKTDKSKLETFSTGAKREDKSGKGRYDLIPGDIMNDVEDLAWETYFQNGVTTCSATDVSKSAYFEDWMDVDLYYDFVINMISYFFIPAEKRVECIDDCGEISYEISWDSFRSGVYEMRKQLALHYEAGAIVHGVDNWKKGIPIYGSDKGGCFLDSMRRHTDQALQDKTDEPHAVAAIWNAFSAAWTLKHRPYSAIYQNASDVKAAEFNTNLLRNKQTTNDIMGSCSSSKSISAN